MRIERLAIGAADRVALLGPNGAGKSTLLRALISAFSPGAFYDRDAPIRFNPNVRLAVFDQAMDALPLSESLVDHVRAVPGVGDQEAVRALARAGFPVARAREPIAVLSHGERARLLFLRLKLERPNLYLLDEPTSHLDIEGQEALEAQLEEGETACLFVSHDRWFVRAVATRFLEIRRGRLVEVESAEEFFAVQGAA